jgi:hypothetical protein
MDEFGDDVREAEHWENAAQDQESEEELDGESHEESEESEQVVRDAIAMQLQNGETNLK